MASRSSPAPTRRHLQQLKGLAAASRLLSVLEARVRSVDSEDASQTDGDEDGGRGPLTVATPVL